MLANLPMARMPQWNVPDRLRAAGLHFILSLVVAVFAAALVFWLWYPGAYRNISGGRDLFFLVVVVDVVLGPLLTFAVFDRSKGWPHLRRDLAVIVALQLAALAYGLYTVYLARPVALVFEKDRFRVISAVEVYLPELPEAPEAFRKLPLTGPWTLSLRETQPGDERKDAMFKAVVEGVDTSQRPKFWVPYDMGRAQAATRARPVGDLLKAHPTHSQTITAALQAQGLSPEQARFLPVRARGEWVALLNPEGTVLGFWPLSGYF
jgi:hypothetical protein